MSSAVGYFSIRNWDKFQHYKHRNPPWIRLYQSLLRDREYQRLSDVQRSHLIGLFLVAAGHDNKIPNDPEWLKHELCTKAPIDLKTLVDSGWLEYTEHVASAVLADCVQLAAPEDRRQKTEKSAPKQLAYGEFASVCLSLDEHAKLTSRLNGSLEGLIDELDRYSQTHPGDFRKYKSHYAVLLTWAERKGITGQGKFKVGDIVV